MFECIDSMIAQLPRELRLEIYERLDYLSSIRLNQVSKFFHHDIDPQRCPEVSKTELVHRAQYWDKHNTCALRGTVEGVICMMLQNGFACYACFRVKPQIEFSASQTSRARAKRYVGDLKPDPGRICIDCSIARRLYRPGSHIRQIVRESLRTRTLFRTIRNWEDGVFCGVCNAVTEYAEVFAPMRCPNGSCSVSGDNERLPSRQPNCLLDFDLAPDLDPEFYEDESLATLDAELWRRSAEVLCKVCSTSYKLRNSEGRCFECSRPLCRACFCAMPNDINQHRCHSTNCCRNLRAWEETQRVELEAQQLRNRSRIRARFVQRFWTETNLIGTSEDLMLEALWT
jgi:hypothetical protein